MASPARRLTSMKSQLPQIREEDTAESFRREIDHTLGTAASRQPRNAFAEESLRVHRHRLAGNAFYQEQFSKRKLTPPTVIHPALRYNTDIYNIAEPLPELDFNVVAGRSSLEMEEGPSPPHARNYRDTTMSRFCNPGSFEGHPPSPSLKLAPSPNMQCEPTMRDELEQRTTTAGDETITVSRPSPKVVSRDFGHHSQQFENTSANKSPASPKKSLLDRFRVGNRRGGVPLKALPPMNIIDGSPTMPAKARAVLVAPPPSRTVIRSPSKTKGLWFRRKPSLSENSEHTAAVHMLKDPPRDSHAIYSNIPRSHSLGYMDNTIPPTPPAKDTPPDEKTRHDAIDPPLSSYQDGTPTRMTGSVTLTSRSSPSKFARLVAQSSTRSLRASIVPDALYGHAYEETKDKIDGLGLANFRVPDGNRQKFELYSPSVYSPDLGVESRATFPLVAAHKHQKSNSASDTELSDMTSYPMIYPDLSRNPSIKSFATPPYEDSDSGASILPYSQHLRRKRRSTIRRDELEVVIHEVKDMLGGGEPSPSHSSLFAIPAGHASAQVSPLHVQPAVFEQNEGQRTSPDLRPILRNSQGEQILPATTYNPWDVQQQSNHSPRRDRRVAGVGGSYAAKKKITQVMAGLEYDSGIDVDPKKSPARDSKSSRHQHTASAPCSMGSRSEKRKSQTDPRTGSPHATELNPTTIAQRRDDMVKQLISSYQQAEIGKRLSDLEEKMKQEDLSRGISDMEERRRFAQEVMFDHRIASLEIERFGREPSPTNCYNTPEMVFRHNSHRLSSSPSHSSRERKSPRHSHHLYSTHPPDDAEDDGPNAKRASTGEAREFYESRLRDPPVVTTGNIDTSPRHRKEPESSSSSGPVRPDDAPYVPASLQESQKIRQLQRKVDRQNEWIQETMARMKALEANVAANRDRH